MEFFTIFKPEHKSFLKEGMIITFKVTDDKHIEVLVTEIGDDKMYFQATNEKDKKYLEETMARAIRQSVSVEEDKDE